MCIPDSANLGLIYCPKESYTCSFGSTQRLRESEVSGVSSLESSNSIRVPMANKLDKLSFNQCMQTHLLSYFPY